MDDVTTRRQLQVAANSGLLHLHVLYLDDKPCAFQLGFQYGSTYFLQKMGFDRDFKKGCVGTVLFLKITDQLCKDPNVDCLDFGFGDADYKRRFGTKHWNESMVYMFAPRVYPVLVNLIYTIVNGLSIGMRWVVHKAGVEGKIKQKWRRLLQKSRNSDSK